MQDKINNDMLRKIELNDVELKNVKVSQINEIFREKFPENTFLEKIDFKNEIFADEDIASKTDEYFKIAQCNYIRTEVKEIVNLDKKIEYEKFLELTNYKEKDILNENYINAIIRDDKYPNTYTDYCDNKVEPLNDSKDKNTEDRCQKVLNLLQLDHLDENEKQSAIKMVAENQDRFHLRGFRGLFYQRMSII